MGCCQSEQNSVADSKDVNRNENVNQENVFLKEISKSSHAPDTKGLGNGSKSLLMANSKGELPEPGSGKRSELYIDHDKVLMPKKTHSFGNLGPNFEVSPNIFVFLKKGDFRESYVMGKLLGEGGYGKVYLVHHKATLIQRAMKIIRKKVLVDKGKESQLINEINLMKNLDHPHIVKLFDLYEDDQNFYLITEICAGGELFERIQKMKSFSEKKAADFIKQILSALVYLHERNIVHRDLKPENLLFDSEDFDSNLKIIDFGLSAFKNDGEMMTDKVGTPYYVAPEVLMKSYDEKCDIWSCGVILYILLCGYPPFRGHNDRVILERVRKAQVVFETEYWRYISPEAKALIKKMLAPTPAERISAIDAMNDPWVQKNMSVTSMPLADRYLQNLSKFNAHKKMRHAIMTLIASQILSQTEKEELEKIFKGLDKDGNGLLTKDELIQGYQLYFPEIEQAEAEVNKILRRISADKSGKIPFTSFIVACMQRESLSHLKLEQAFKIFDFDGDGNITKVELIQAMGGLELSEADWDTLMNEFDVNRDGQISFEEFVKLMMDHFKG